MSEHFTHIAVYEDTARIILSSDDFCNAFKKCITDFYDSGMLGSTSRGNHLFAIPILEEYKDKWETALDEHAMLKIAYAIGWITHRASDHQMKPVLRATEALNDPRYNGYINSIYHDAMSFRQVYDGGNIPSVSDKEALSPATFAYNMESHPAAKAVNVAAAEPLFNRMWQKDLMATWRFIDDQTMFEEWLDTFIDRFADLSENFQDYEEAFNDPDPVLTQKYYDQDNLYNDSDDIIQYVRAVQRGKQPDVELQAALKSAETGSEYAQALRRGYDYVKAANEFFIGTISKDAAYDALSINNKFRF